ncbi:hypothetical protein DM02DRAFT_569563 [Periconia macrospinosa]|uniref:Aromatic prenyltransferase n=1 Tax=Periconia macrospinosa TaxID=97972 RepID=A0A2V1DH47_9PLEO|nr:hypothetical protein DM02DRAFT_569563 [Periconia macrospinosa]
MAATAEKFDRSTFQSELSTLCHSLDAPYSSKVTEQILGAFDEYLDDSYVWFRCTSKPADVVNFRLAFHGKRIDTTAILASAGWIGYDDELAKIVRSWSSHEDAEQWCDFDPSRGIAKNWIYFRDLQPIQEILCTHGLPAPAAARLQDLQAAGLEKVNFAAVDYANRSMNVYFLLPGGLTAERAAKYVGLAGSKPLSDEDIQIISDSTHPMQTFGVTIIPETGHIPRVAFYAPVKDAANFPALKNERMRKFFAEHPSRDPRKIHILSWSYGGGDSKTYMKGEASYAGYSEELSRDMFLRWIK